jgi:quinohemoprotein ethanol dehydrogenase
MRWIGLIVGVLILSSCSFMNGSAQNTDWDLLGNSSEMQHHSDLDEINTKNIGQLELAWSVEMPTQSGLVGNPLIKDGVVFQGGPGGLIFANDVRTGKELWSFLPEPKIEEASLGALISHQTNRGLALFEDLVIIGTGDCRMIGVNQKTGKQVWETQSCNPKEWYGITGAPRVGGGKVFIGNSCMDSGMTRGFVEGFDARTGKKLWRFYTVPGDPAKPAEDEVQAMAAKSWGTDWYGKSKGCASVWDALTYDEKLDQLYIGTGGAGPWVPEQRAADAGDELFTNSIVALDAKTGKYKWHFKQVPQDGWNYEAAMGIMVADLPIEGKSRRTVLSVPKNGFAYVLDAVTGKFISGKNYVDVNWTKGLDANGRPIPEPAAMYWKNAQKKAVMYPSTMGSHGWEALAFDPKSNLLFIPAMTIPTEIGMEAGGNTGIYMNFYAGDEPGAKVKPYGEIVAWDPTKQKEVWRTSKTKLPINGGLMHTAGGLVFQGHADGKFAAYDAKTGKELWSRQTGGAIRGAASTVMVDGEQFIIIATGNGAASSTASYVARYTGTALSRTPPRLLAFKIGGKAKYPSLGKPEPTPVPPAPRFDKALVKRGEVVFHINSCAACHGAKGAAVGGRVPNLNRMPPADLAMLKTVVQEGALKASGMPQYKDMTDDDAKALFAYIIEEAWESHEEEKRKIIGQPFKQ